MLEKTPALGAHSKLLPSGWFKWAGFALPAQQHLGRQRGQRAGLGCALAARLGGMGTSLLTARQAFGEPRPVLWLQVSSQAQTLSSLFCFTPTFWSLVLGP